MSTDWYKIHFQDKLNQLYEIRKNAFGSQLEKIDETIYTIETLINPSKKTDFKGEYSIYSTLEQENYNLTNDKAFLPFLTPIIESSSIPNKNVYVPSPKLSDNDLLDFINDFFKKSLSPNMYSVFLRMFKRKSSWVHMTMLREDSFQGDAVFLSYFKEVHIRLKRNKDITDLSNLAHEYGHGIQFLTNYQPEFYGENVIFSEIVSTFFELLLCDYMKTMGAFRKGAIQLEKDLYNEIRKKSNLLIVEAKLMTKYQELKVNTNVDYLKILSRELKKLALECGDELSNLDLKTLLKQQLSKFLIYIIGYLIAIEIFMVYKYDKDKGLWLLDRLMNIKLNIPRYEYYGNILGLNIRPNENLEEYRKFIL